MVESLKETLSASPENACRPVLLVEIRGQAGRQGHSARFLSQSRHRGLIRSSNDSQPRNR